MDDSRNRPGVGIFRIFQQSLKEMGSVMEHKRTTQGHKERETAHDKGVVRDDTSVDADRHVNKVDPKTNSDKLGSFTSETNDEKHKFTSNYVRKGSRGVSDRKIKLLQSKYHRRPDRSSTVSANASRLPPYKRHKSPVKRVSPQEKHFTDMSASLTHERGKDNRNIADSEDWSNELIDVTVDSNHNIVELLSPEPFIDSAGQNVQNSKDIERNQKTDSINNEENNNTYNEINGNIQTCLNPITFLENKTKLGIEKNESKTELEILNLKIEHNGNHGISNVNRTSKLDVNNSNSIEHYSSKKPSEKYKHTSTEDWSLELDEVDVDLFILQKSRNTSTPLGFSSHEESNTSKEQSCPISGKVENDSEHYFQVEIRSEPVVPSAGGPNSNIWFEMQNDVQLETKADNLSNPALATEIKTEPNNGLLITKSENNNINQIVKHSEVESQVLCQMSTSKENASFNVVSEIQAPEKGCSMKEFDQAIEIKATDERECSELAEMKGTEDMNLNFYTDFKDKSKGSMENLNTCNKLNDGLDGAEITINKGFGQNKEDDRSDMKVKDELLQVIDLKIKTDISRKGFVEHVQRRVESKVDRNTGVCNQNKEVRRHFDQRASQSNVRDKRNDSSSGFSRNSKLRNNLNYNERLSSNHNDDMIPPRFRKQPSPINANKISNNKYGHATSTSLIPNLRPTYPDDRHFQRRKGFDNLGRVNENRFGSNVIDQIPAADSQRSTHHENKVNIKSEINKHSNLKAFETSVHVPENWHDEIDNTMHLAEKAMENSDNENNNNVMIVADAGSENYQCNQKVSNDQNYKQETCHLPKSVPWRINEVEKLEISVENIDKLVEADIQREKVPYLPPSPDELEQASFMTFLTKSGNDVVKSVGDNTVDVEKDLTDQKPDEKNQNVDNNDLTFPLDLQSDQGFDPSSANEQWVAVSKNELQKITETETHQTECVDNGSFNDTESLEGTDERVVTGNSETDSRLDARVLIGCENCEENDKIAVSGRLDSETNDGTESALNASYEFVADNVDEKCNREIETQIIIPEKGDVVHGHGNFIVNTNDFLVEENVITSNEVEEDKGKFKASPMYIQAERGKTEPPNRIGYPPTGPWEAHPSQFYGNQIYQSPWQHCHPSYYYSEQYRRWYEQVYVPQYQRYMQLYGYYGVPDDYYGQPYSDNVRPTHGLDRDRQTVGESHEQRVQRRTHSGGINRHMSEERQKQNETESHKAFTSQKISNPTEEASKEKVLENKLSDYWADRMPDWVDKQCKIAKLKNETQGEDDNVVKPNELDLKTQKSNNQIASETSTGTKLKRDTVKSEIEKQAFVKTKLDQVNGNNSDFKGSGYKHESVNGKEELKSLMSNSKEGIKRHDNKTTVLAEKTSLSDTKKEDVRTIEEDSKADKDENEKSLKKDISLVDIATSDSNPVLTASDSDSFLQPKTGCTCGPDDIQYFLCKTCQCSAGRVPAPEDFVHVYPEERCMDQGYQSFDSLVAEEGAPAVRARNQPENHQSRAIYFSLASRVRHSTPQPHDRRSELDAQNRSRSECDRSRSECDRSTSELTAGNQERVNKPKVTQKPANTIGKVGTPPGFRIGMHKPRDQKKDDHRLQPCRLNMESFKSNTNSERCSSVDFNENLIGDLSSSGQRQRRRSGDQLRQQVDHKLKELIELSKAKTEALKAAKKKNLTQKENVEKVQKPQAKQDHSDSTDTRVVVLNKKEMESNVSQEDSYSHPLRHQMEKVRSKNRLEALIKQMPTATGDQYRSNWHCSPHSVESSSEDRKVEKMHMKGQKTTETVDNSDFVNANIRKDSYDNETKPHEQVHQKTHSHDIVKLAEKRDEKTKMHGDGGNEVECSVNMKALRGRNSAYIEGNSSSSGEDKLLDEVKSQSTEEKQSSEIKEHGIVEGNLTEQGFCSRKMEGIPCNKDLDKNNNSMPEFQQRQPGFGYPGYRMPYRLQHSASPFDYRTRIPPTSMRSPTNFSERSFIDNRWGATREESSSNMPPRPWMNTRAPVFRPRNFEETPLFPSPWYMPPPPPPPLYPPRGTINEEHRKIGRPVHEEIVPSQYEDSSFTSPFTPKAAATGNTGITPDLEKMATSTEKCLDRQKKKGKLVDYVYSDGELTPSDDEIEGFDETSLDSGDIENVRPRHQYSSADVVKESEKIGHTAKRLKVGSSRENIDLSEEAFPDLDTAAKMVSTPKGTAFARRPMKKLKQTLLKAFPNENLATEQPKFKETLKKNMTLSEVVAASLKKDDAHDLTGGVGSKKATTEQLYSAKCQQSMAPYPPPLLPPFPASPFWGMYLTNSRSALEGKDPNEDLFSQINPAIPGPRGILGSWNRPLLSPSMRRDPRLLFSPSETDSENQSKKSDGVKQFKRFHNFGVKYIDTHCHLDFLFNRTNFNGNLKAFIEENPEVFPETFEGCIAIFCYPTSFSPTDPVLVRLMEEDNVWFAMGCHPKMATEYNEKAEVGMKECLKHPKCVALGEIGLDYSGSFKQHEERQKAVFKRQLHLAVKMNKPLVIHCRDAEEDCLEIMKEHVPPKYKIHCHCFTGSYANAQLWMDAFPQLMIGLTPLVTYPSATPSHDLARQIPLDKLLLETDAPYFVPRCRPRLDMEFSNPGLAITVAKAVAQHKEIPVSMVLRHCRVNTKTMYGI